MRVIAALCYLSVSYALRLPTKLKEEDSGTDWPWDFGGGNKPQVATKHQSQCDISKGTWQKVQVPPSYDRGRVYDEFRCPHKKADQFKWVPDDCELPAFQASTMSSIVSTRPILMIGDSLVHNMYESLKMLMSKGNHGMGGITYRSERYFGSRASPIGEGSLGKDFPETHLIGEDLELVRMLVNISQTDFQFLADVNKYGVVMLGGGHHYAHRGNEYYWQGAALKDTGGDVNVEAYRLGLTQLLHHLEKMGFTGHVILQTYSPAHFFYGDWDSNGSCDGKTEPIVDANEYEYLGSAGGANIQEVNSMLKSMTSSRFKISIFDITAMSWGRADAHPGNETKNDCAHWCLPGVPDVWNEAFLRMLR